MDLFADEPGPPSARHKRASASQVDAARPDHGTSELGAALPPRIWLGTSTWSFPDWDGLVWRGKYSESQLSRDGLPAYAAHPLLRAVGIDRSFYRPLTREQYAHYASQVPENFRFVVKAPALVADATLRGGDGRGRGLNPSFLDPQLALNEFVEPALAGLGAKAGALVFQLSPLPIDWLPAGSALLDRLAAMLESFTSARALAPEAAIAIELRNRDLLSPALVSVLRAHSATYCLGIHPRMPSAEDQLPVLRALWPGPMVARWSLNQVHGIHGYGAAKRAYAGFDQLHDPDPISRRNLAKVAAATAAAGFNAFVIINNKAEGSAPLSVGALADAICHPMGGT